MIPVDETCRLVWHKLTRGASANAPLHLWLLGTPTPVIDAIRRAVAPPQEHRYGARSDGPTPPDWDRISAAFEALVVAFQATQAGRLSGIESRRRAAVLAAAKAAYIESFPVAPMAAGFTLSMIDRDLGFRPDWVSWPQDAATTGTEFTLVRAGIARMATRSAPEPLRATPVPAVAPVAPVGPVAAPRSPFPTRFGPPKLSRMPGGFDGFDTPEEEPVRTWQYHARQALTTAMKGEGQYLLVSELLRPGEAMLPVEANGFYFEHRTGAYGIDRAVLLLAPNVASEAQAEKVAKGLQRKLIAKKKADGLAYYTHLSRIVVAGPTGAWSFAPLDDGAAPVRRLTGEGDTVTAAKERLLMAVQEAGVFTDARIIGSTAKGYTLHMRPRPTKKLRFAAEYMRIRDWESAHEAVAEAARRVTAAIAKLTAES